MVTQPQYDRASLMLQAISLRGQGKTYLEIASELGKPRSTIVSWLANHRFSANEVATVQARLKTSMLSRMPQLTISERRDRP